MEKKYGGKEREDLLASLRDCGAEVVRASYDGGGDSGQIDEVTITGHEKKPVKGKKTKGKVASSFIDSTGEWKEIVKLKMVSLEEKVKDFFYSALSSYHGGWENDDGGFGEFEWDLKTDVIKFVHNERYTEVNTEEHEL
jgi:hypothetical protein